MHGIFDYTVPVETYALNELNHTKMGYHRYRLLPL